MCTGASLEVSTRAGYKVLHQIRMSGMAVHVIVVTAASAADTERRAHNCGASLVLTKPLNPHRLVSEIERLLAS